jgi:hypothetical protein
MEVLLLINDVNHTSVTSPPLQVLAFDIVHMLEGQKSLLVDLITLRYYSYNGYNVPFLYHST